MHLPSQPFWFKQAIIKHVPKYAKLIGKQGKVNVAIVGSGITGLSTAIKLKESGKKVAVIEGAKVGQGVTGYTTGKVTSLHRLSFAQVASMMGEDKAKLYAEFNEDGISIVEENIKKYSIECDFERRDNFTYTQDEKMVEQILDEVKVALKCGLNASFTENVELPFSIRGAIKLENQAYFNAYAYCLGLAKAFHGNGCSIYEDSRVKNVHGISSPHRVETFEGEIEADFVVIATHLPILDRSGHFAILPPEKSYCLAFTLEDESKMPKQMYITAEEPTRSIRPADNNKVLIIAGAGHHHGECPRESTEEQYEELEKWTKQNFPVKEVIAKWSALDYMSPDKVPYIGYLHRGTGSIFTATGYKKWGLAAAASAANVISDLIENKQNKYFSLVDSRRWDVLNIGGDVAKIQVHVAKDFIQDRVKYMLSVPDIEDLENGKGAICKYNGETVAGYKDENGNIHAVSPVCTHLGCYVRWNQADKTWDCPCHGSMFDVDGQVLHGPAVKNLTPKHAKL